MRNFITWLESQSNISININNFANRIKHGFDSLLSWSIDRRNKLQGFKLDQNLINQGVSDYPRKQVLLNSLGKPYARNEINKFAQWTFDQTSRSTEMRNAWRHLSDYEDSLEKHDPEATEQEYLKNYQEVIQKTQQNMVKWKTVIEEAISRIPDWNGTVIILEPNEFYETDNRVSLTPADNLFVRMGLSGNASFSLGYSEDHKGNIKLDIDDILEGGEEDEEFFANSKEKRDYFNLINEIKNPGASNKKRILTLYTARPVKDREFYSSTKTLPENIFLTNSADHAEGLAHDLSSGDKRDLWRVRIDSKYLTQTLDGLVKYYQVTTPNAPADISMY